MVWKFCEIWKSYVNGFQKGQILPDCYLTVWGMARMLASFCGTSANSAEPDQMPQNVASDQVLHRLLTEIENVLLKFERLCNRFVQLIKAGNSIRHKWIN